jgi:uncharacterized protein YhaN
LKLATKILQDQVEKYRSENQSALLSRAGEHFAQLTLRSFESLVADYDDQGEPVIVGGRQSGEKVSVAGLSAGTRDQLYLALRLATLERYLDQTEEPMPFIVDDILINFDDKRSAATLHVLVELSKKTQVILFTHHSRVRELAESLSQRSETFVHELHGDNRQADGG